MSDERDNLDEEQKKKFAELLQQEGFQAPASLGQQKADTVGVEEINDLSGYAAQYSAEFNPVETVATLEDAGAGLRDAGVTQDADQQPDQDTIEAVEQWQEAAQAAQQDATEAQKAQKQSETVWEEPGSSQLAQQFEQQSSTLPEPPEPSQLEQQMEQQLAEPEHSSVLAEAHEESTAEQSEPNQEAAFWDAAVSAVQQATYSPEMQAEYSEGKTEQTPEAEEPGQEQPEAENVEEAPAVEEIESGFTQEDWDEIARDMEAVAQEDAFRSTAPVREAANDNEPTPTGQEVEATAEEEMEAVLDQYVETGDYDQGQEQEQDRDELSR